MLIVDSQKAAEIAESNARAAARQQTFNWIKEQTKDSVYLQDPDRAPTNFEYQMGRALSVHEVERRLKKLCPKLVFENNPYNQSKKAMYYILPNGEKQLIMPYENGVIPEHSVLQGVIKETLSPEIVGGGILSRPFHIERADLTKHEVRPHEFDEQGNLTRPGDVIWDETEAQVGMERTRIPWAERIRGWRTMLFILVSAGLITPTQAENAFGSSDRPEWQHRMGKKTQKILGNSL